MYGLALILTTIYLSGVVFYSALFIFSANQDPVMQTVKIFVAGAHILILIIPVALAKSQHIASKAFGFGLVTAFFLYAIFIVGFFPYFGFIPELYAFDFGSVSDLSEVLDHYFRQIFGWQEIALLALFVTLIWQTIKIPIPAFSVTVFIVPVLLIAANIYAFGAPQYSVDFGSVTVLRRFGPIVFSYKSLSSLPSFGDEYLEEKRANPGKVAKLIWETETPTQKFISEIPEVSRVTIVQIESFDPVAIDARISNIPVMPFVSDLRDTCLNYQNFFTLKGAGGSSDAEFAIATGLVPTARLASLKHTDFLEVGTLYEILEANGISSVFSHNNHSGFYGRNKAYAQIPSLQTQFLKPGDPVAEIMFAQESLSNTLQSSEKSLHYFFNFKSHGPYQGYSMATEEKFSIHRSDDIRTDYLATMSEVDQMIKALFELQEVGFANGDNLFILTADHPSMLHVSDDQLSRYRIPAMICHQEFDGDEVPNVFSSIDVFPTILEAFGLNMDIQYLGQSMFWDVRNAALLPQRAIIYQNSDGTPIKVPCDAKCDAFFKYTEQHIRP